MKISLSVIILLVVVSVAPNRVMAENTLTAQKLLQVCTTLNMEWISFCNGFFQAVHDQQALAGKVCAPEGTSRTNLVEVYETNAAILIERDPAVGEKPAVDIAGKILIAVFPCD